MEADAAELGEEPRRSAAKSGFREVGFAVVAGVEVFGRTSVVRGWASRDAQSATGRVGSAEPLAAAPDN